MFQRYGAREALTLFLGGTVYAGGAYYAYHLFRVKKDFQDIQDELALAQALQQYDKDTTSTHDNHHNHTNCSCTAHLLRNPETRRVQQFNHIAAKYDQAIGTDEWLLGINLLRRLLVTTHAQGTVLEVGAGTGRNIHAYQASKARRVLLVELSEGMCEQARQKTQAAVAQQVENAKYSTTTKQRAPTQFVVQQGDSQQLTTFLPARAFDTVVDTFGLCSYQQPVTVLQQMISMCKPGGKILLLEHGRSQSTGVLGRAMNWWLDQNAAEHARNWGCIWNRNLDALLEEIQDEVDIVVSSRYHFGTTYYVVCQPKAKATEGEPLSGAETVESIAR